MWMPAHTTRPPFRTALSATGTGHVVAVATGAPAAEKLERSDRKQVAWIQVTRLGITSRIDGERVNAWTQDITPSRFLRPIPGVAASLLVDGRADAPAPVTTDAEGHAVFDLLAPKDDSYRHRALLLARHAAVGGELIRVGISRVEPMGNMNAWRPALPVTQWLWCKP